MSTSEFVTPIRATVGVLDMPLALLSPRALFSRVEDTGAYGWALVTLLGLITLLGYLEVQTGLIDRVVDQGTETALAELEQSQAHLVDRVQLRERMDEIRKGGEFTKLLSRLGVIVFAPTWLLASFMFIASILYAVVALTGRKPEYHTLMSICVYSGMTELVGSIVRFAMVVGYKTTEMDTSLEMLAAPGEPSPLSAIDPFRIWFWVLVAVGLAVTRQLSRTMAIVSCVLMALTAAGVRVALAYAGVT